ncbi:hypothetical protein DY000_02049527 [Brassica cretica]|uniref:CBS domain-containing protein n=1 Tax=Brassica cretica TaxID=69181 RepID=A0ABQ7F4B0_BRACR|nr:hypothetical protein DY000_02049527 [Brassica cretica]
MLSEYARFFAKTSVLCLNEFLEGLGYVGAREIRGYGRLSHFSQTKFTDLVNEDVNLYYTPPTVEPDTLKPNKDSSDKKIIASAISWMGDQLRIFHEPQVMVIISGDKDFVPATSPASSGTVFFTGVGKSAFVANKISQTLISLNLRSSFLSPLDALHGDIGALSSSDVRVLFSKSGYTEELLRLVHCAKARGAFLVSLTSVPGNPLAGVCDMNVHLPLQRELCPFNLAPVTSTMVFGDTIAVALMGARNLTKEEYGANHHADGDLRRTLKASGEAIFKLSVGEMCNRNPRTIGPETMAVEAMKKMESPPSPVQFLPVVNEENTLIGILTLHGLVSAGL